MASLVPILAVRDKVKVCVNPVVRTKLLEDANVVAEVTVVSVAASVT